MICEKDDLGLEKREGDPGHIQEIQSKVLSSNLAVRAVGEVEDNSWD